MQDAPFSYSHALPKKDQYDKSDTLTVRGDTYPEFAANLEHVLGEVNASLLLLGFQSTPDELTQATAKITEAFNAQPEAPTPPPPPVATVTPIKRPETQSAQAGQPPPPTSAPNQTCDKCGAPTQWKWSRKYSKYFASCVNWARDDGVH